MESQIVFFWLFPFVPSLLCPRSLQYMISPTAIIIISTGPKKPVCMVPSWAFWLGAKLIMAVLSWAFVAPHHQPILIPYPPSPIPWMLFSTATCIIYYCTLVSKMIFFKKICLKHLRKGYNFVKLRRKFPQLIWHSYCPFCFVFTQKVFREGSEKNWFSNEWKYS